MQKRLRKGKKIQTRIYILNNYSEIRISKVMMKMLIKDKTFKRKELKI